MTIRAVISRFRSQRRPLSVIVVLTVVASIAEAAGLVMVVALAQAVSTGESNFDGTLGPIDLMMSRGSLGAWAVTAVSLSVVLTLVVNYLRARLATSWGAEQRDGVISSFLAADWPHQAEYRHGHLQALIGYVNQGANILQALANGSRGLFGVGVLMVTAMVVSPAGALGILLVGVFLFGVLRPMTMAVRRRNRQLAHAQWFFNEGLGELSELTLDLRVFCAEPHFRESLSESNQTLSGLERRAGTLSGALAPIYQGVALLIVVMALVIAGIRGGDVATLGAVALLLLRSVSYGQQLQISYNAIHTGIPHLEKADELLAGIANSTTVDGSSELRRVERIEMRHVSFSYPDGTSALEEVDLDLRFGEIVGIVGPSGSGKSTLAQLLLRLRDPGEGELLANGAPVSRYSRQSWYRQTSLVPQATHLFHESAFNNITFFRPWVTLEDVERAAKAAGIHETILSLPEAYETEVGATMRNLSGGQVQRIGIARALAGRPSVLVLDEPTSALDQNSEALVQSALESLRDEMLVVVIAHRLSTLSICDRIVVMNDGRVEASGTLAQALEASPFFREAFDRGGLPVERFAP